MNQSQAVLTHYSLAGRPWPRAKANRPPACLGLLCRAWEGREAPTPGPCCGQCARVAAASPAPAWLRGQVWAELPLGSGLAVLEKLVLLRVFLLLVPGSSPSAEGEAMTWPPHVTHVANAMASPGACH